jgi:hypothetical protein
MVSSTKAKAEISTETYVVPYCLKESEQCLSKSLTHVTLHVRKINDICTKTFSKAKDNAPRNNMKDKLRQKNSTRMSGKTVRNLKQKELTENHKSTKL